MHPAIEQCLRAGTAVPAAPTLADWQPGWQSLLASGAAPIGLALLGGFGADRPAWAFAAGYQAALRCLLPHTPPRALVGLCLTEATGKRPRELQSTATPQADGSWLLSGDKSWVAFGQACTTLLVIARDGSAPAEGSAGVSPRLLALCLPHDSPGVQVADKPPGRLLPELPQGRLTLQQVRLPGAARLPGDGYADHAKPFAALEDLYIGAALLACLLREARARAWPADQQARLVALLTLLCALAETPLRDPAGLVALAGALDLARQAQAEAGARWAAAPDDPAGQRWQRDGPLLGASGPSRVQRAAKAWAQLAGGTPQAAPDPPPRPP